MKFSRSGGVLLHPTSLPGPYGIGDLGPQAYRFVDWLESTGCKLWQVLPLGPTGYGDLPYQCFSAFAGNPYLISFDALIEDGLLTKDDFADMPDFSASRVDFGGLIPWKLDLLQKAFSRFASASEDIRKGFEYFCCRKCLLARRLRLIHGSQGSKWRWRLERLDKGHPHTQENCNGHEHARKTPKAYCVIPFINFFFFVSGTNCAHMQMNANIQIIGDIPIFIAYDSADAWANPELFFLDENSLPTVVAGVPPDYFSPTGQLWGNPLYRWDAHKETGYAWWLERFRAVLKLVDIVRLDHFRGFAGYYEIQAGQPTAEHGRWVPGPGSDFFRVVAAHLSDGSSTSQIELPIIAEDLGVITPDVAEMRDEFRLPGMKILQFGFSSPKDPFLPHNYPSHCVAYTGTHDNDTARGWFESAPESERKFALRYLKSDGSDFAWDLMRAVWSSVATYALRRCRIY